MKNIITNGIEFKSCDDVQKSLKFINIKFDKIIGDLLSANILEDNEYFKELKAENIRLRDHVLYLEIDILMVKYDLNDCEFVVGG